MTKTESIIRRDTAWAARFPRRIFARQKEAFLQTLDEELQGMGYLTQRVRVNTLLTNRLLVTTCAQPEVIFTAHYDTPTIMPFWLNPFFRIFGHTQQIPMMIVLIVALQVPSLVLGLIAARFPALESATAAALVAYFVILGVSLVTAAIPNPHNREDNTSGVIGLMALAEWAKDRPEIKARVQFAFLDNEEWGMIGSGALKDWWRKQKHPYSQAQIINLDCISRGKVPLIVHHGKDQLARRLLPFLQKHLPETRLVNMGVIPLSDNYTFRKQGAVDITYTDAALFPGGYYVPKIHVIQDNDLSAERLAACVSALTDFLQQPESAQRREGA
ncbi:MAG: M28 family peptidase [Chloroflexota bacterium]